MKKYFNFLLLTIFFLSAKVATSQNKLWYRQPAKSWTEALPLGNGRLGAMVFGGVPTAHIQFNEETLWTGQPHDYAHQGASAYLDEIRQLLFDGKQKEAEELAMKHFMSVPLRQKSYQPFGDILLDFPAHATYTDYRRELDLNEAICRTRYRVKNVLYQREVFVSQPDQVLVSHLTASQPGSLTFDLHFDSPHKNTSFSMDQNTLEMSVTVADGGMQGLSKIAVKTDGEIKILDKQIRVLHASYATLLLSATTNFINYKTLALVPSDKVNTYLTKAMEKSYGELKERHLAEYKSYFDKFDIGFGQQANEQRPTDERLRSFREHPDTNLLALYVQYGRYLLIASSRPGTYPANLQGIWNAQLKPPWDSKYTVNINTEMNYWPAEVTNLSACTSPLFRLIAECAESGRVTAREHYYAHGWVLHHNTDQWRGTAPINHANHGIWVSGGGWLSTHLWEHFLFNCDTAFLRDTAYPIMREAARFYKDFLVEDPQTGWLISSPSNSPENGGLVAGPTMDHQIIRSLFKACIKSSKILNADKLFADSLATMIPRIAPNQIGQYGQLQEWLEDVDDTTNHHRHVSHLWGIYPGKDINWEDNAKMMNAARQSLLFRGDDGTGWSLAWKINFWARLLEGDHAWKMINMLFRYVDNQKTRYHKGGSYPNLFDAHPPFQIDGNFGATAGVLEMLIQSHLSAIELLPALPKALPRGHVTGACARGGFEVSFAWEDHQLKSVRILSKVGNRCTMKYNGLEISFETNPGATYQFDGNMNLIKD